MYRLDYSEEKNELLKRVRGIGFEQIIEAIETGGILDEINHFNSEKYPNQRIYLVNYKKYVYAVPYVVDHKRKVIFLKTIYPNRKLKREYVK